MALKISIVTISYNQAAYLEQTIRSVLDQEYQNLEYIVVDPGSTDGSRNIIDRYRRQIDKVIFDPDTGPADGLNKGFSYATGDLFGYINADDFYIPGSFQIISDVFNRNILCSVVYGHGYIVNSHGETIRRFRSGLFSCNRFIYGGSPICQQATFFRRQTISNVGSFNHLNKSCWDAELVLKIDRQGYKFKRINEYLGAFRIHEKSITGSKRLNHQYKIDCDRIFKMISGQERQKKDKIIYFLMRYLKWIYDPIGFVLRLQDYFSAPKKSMTSII